MLLTWGELLKEKQAGIRQSDCVSDNSLNSSENLILFLQNLFPLVILSKIVLKYRRLQWDYPFFGKHINCCVMQCIFYSYIAYSLLYPTLR